MAFNDVALIKLEKKLDFEGEHKNLAPICLADNSLNVDGKECVSIGWGRLAYGTFFLFCGNIGFEFFHPTFNHNFNV